MPPLQENCMTKLIEGFAGRECTDLCDREQQVSRTPKDVAKDRN